MMVLFLHSVGGSAAPTTYSTEEWGGWSVIFITVYIHVYICIYSIYTHIYEVTLIPPPLSSTPRKDVRY
jgi:hypothetical protein